MWPNLDLKKLSGFIWDEQHQGRQPSTERPNGRGLVHPYIVKLKGRVEIEIEMLAFKNRDFRDFPEIEIGVKNTMILPDFSILDRDRNLRYITCHDTLKPSTK